jgi:hypothetical protein
MPRLPHLPWLLLAVLPAPAFAEAKAAAAVPEAVRALVGEAFPERRAVGRAMLSESFDPNLRVSERSSLTVTFLSGNSSYRNAFGYFTFRNDGGVVKVLERGWVFPREGDAAKPGDTAPLRDATGQVRYFEPGTQVGFFLVADGARLASLDLTALPSADPKQNAAVAAGLFTTVDALNPEATEKPALARHVAMVQAPGVPGFLGGAPLMLVGFEDLRRDKGSDEDFNDLVFVVRGEHAGTLAQTPVLATGGGKGADDAFPSDPDRTGIHRVPSTGMTGVPGLGVHGAEEDVTTTRGLVRDVSLTFERAAGSGAATLLVPLPAHARGTVRVERFVGAADALREPERRLESLAQTAKDGAQTLALDELFTGDAAQPEAVRVVITFDEAQALPVAEGKGAVAWKLQSVLAPSKAPVAARLFAPRAWTLLPGR